MSRSTNEQVMTSISALRPDEAHHPEEVLGADYLEQLVQVARQVSTVELSQELEIHDGHLDKRRWVAMAGVVAVVAALIVAGVGLWNGANTPMNSHAIQPIPWRAVDATFPNPFVREAAKSPNRSEIMTCPTTSRCYLVANGKGDLTGYKSNDGGLNWVTLVIPDVSLSTPFTCPNAGTCFAGGILLSGVGVHSVLLVTSDGGATWQTKSFGAAPVFDSLNCPSASTCVATAGGLNYGPNTVPQEDVYWSNDAGNTWRQAMSLPSGLVLSLSCPTVTTCIGLTYVQPAHTPTIESFRTTDGGYTWQSGTVEVEGVAFSAPSCADASHCVAIVQTTPKPDPSVPGTLVALSSVDGGQSWQSHELPASISTDALGVSPSCPTDNQCWAPILLHQDQGTPQPVIAATTDGGQTWQRVPINDSCMPSGCITYIQTLQCPSPSSCLALGDLSDFHLPPVLMTNHPTESQ